MRLPTIYWQSASASGFTPSSAFVAMPKSMDMAQTPQYAQVLQVWSARKKGTKSELFSVIRFPVLEAGNPCRSPRRYQGADPSSVKTAKPQLLTKASWTNVLWFSERLRSYHQLRKWCLTQSANRDGNWRSLSKTWERQDRRQTNS